MMQTRILNLPRFDRQEIRQYIDTPMSEGQNIILNKQDSHYLSHVMRVETGSMITIFNGRDGAFKAEITRDNKKIALFLKEHTDQQPKTHKLALICAPLKTARAEYQVQKAVEMGVSDIYPVQMQHGQIPKINTEKWQRYAIEAAEQCRILSIPKVHDMGKLEKILGDLKDNHHFLFCDEKADTDNSFKNLSQNEGLAPALIIGPEGGFSQNERNLLLRMEKTNIISLGPRILRADTACVAALALIQAEIGDWYSPCFEQNLNAE